ncbi:hypothetical protein [Hydrogenophaga sp.]|uniref:Cap15 family cyclic dinucleotide receptor domain-containing protein n=1 Tax=Hydrogenophaga sp. TaxID=1904254 RepID=UPI00286E3168|nr:hypothetical protein [Hydrogenophaga sp.]
MNLLSLTYPELERLLKFFAGVTVVLAALIGLLRWAAFGASEWAAVWQGVTTALSISALAFGFFSRMTWTSPKLAKWLGRPIVHGLWFGNLDSNYDDKKGAPPPQIEIAFVIRQTYLTLSIESFTKNQDGESKVEALLQNSKTEATRIGYIYELSKLYQGKSSKTSGAGELKLHEAGKRLKGHYWTNSPTQGLIELDFVTRDIDGVDNFEVAAKIWGLAQRPDAPTRSGGAS